MDLSINVTTVLFHFSFFFIPYLFYRWFYKNRLHTNYRWHQRGNVCYEDRIVFAICWARATGIIIELVFVNQVIKFHF